MADETPDAKGVGGGGDGNGASSSARSKSERRDYADAIVHWATAVSRLLAVVDAWDAFVQDLRATGATLDGADRDRKITDIMRTIERLREGEEAASETRVYLDGLVKSLRMET